MLLRHATLSDLSSLKQFQQRLVIYERPFDSTIPKKGEVTYYDIRELIESDKAQFLVAEADHKIVGCGFGQIRKDAYWSVNKQVGYIGLMFVDEQWRNQGIGRLVISALLSWFKENNIFDVRLKVYEENHDAVKAYKKCGFKDYVKEMRCTIE